MAVILFIGISRSKSFNTGISEPIYQKNNFFTSIAESLENTANFEDVFFLKSILNSVGLKKGNFMFPLQEVPILLLGDIDSEYALFQNSYMRYVLNKKLQPFANQILANKISLSELKNRLEILLVQLELEKSALHFKKKELNRNETLFKRGIISAQKFESKQLEYLKAEQSIKNLNISISQTREAIAMAEKTSKGTSIEKTRKTMSLLKEVVQAFHQLKIAIEKWERQYVLLSEIQGKVAFMNYWSENQTVKQGDLVFTIVPTRTLEYIAKLKVPAQNSGKSRLGKK